MFSSEKEYIRLPLHYNEYIQGLIYKSLPEAMSRFLHDVGFLYEGKRFKLYTYSNIISKSFEINKKDKTAIFKTPIVIYFSSAIENITQEFGIELLKKEHITLFKDNLLLQEIELLNKPSIKTNTFKIKTLSPITIYKTIEKDGKKFYNYYNPYNIEFSELLKQNIKRKYEIITGKRLGDFDFSIKPSNSIKKALIKYKDFLIEGYAGIFDITINPEIFLTIYDAGLGSKNSQGLGMIEIVKKN